MSLYSKREVAGGGLVMLALAVGTVIANLLLLAGAVFVVVWVLQQMGVI